jgi:hypothetical protein
MRSSISRGVLPIFRKLQRGDPAIDSWLGLPLLIGRC